MNDVMFPLMLVPNLSGDVRGDSKSGTYAFDQHRDVTVTNFGQRHHRRRLVGGASAALGAFVDSGAHVASSGPVHHTVAFGDVVSTTDQSNARRQHRPPLVATANADLTLHSLHLKNTVMKYGKYSTEQQPQQQSIRCTVPSCSCDCFVPDKLRIRNCDNCRHGWVAHALDKLGLRHMYNCAPVEVVQSNTVFDIASLMLFGTTATPIRLKILLDRLFSVLQHEEVLHVLNGFGWTYEDYARGYILQDKGGNVLDKWSMPTREEEAIILQQFLRFGETKSITQQLLMQESNERVDYAVNSHAAKTESDIKKFIERANHAAVSALSHVRNNQEKSFQRLPSNASSSQNLSPTSSSGSFGSPTYCTSPSLSASPLNKLQSMHPYDYRKSRLSPSELPHSSSVQPKHSITSPITTMPPHMSMVNSTAKINASKSLQLPHSLSSTAVSANDNSFELSATEWGSDEDSLGANSCGALNLSTAGPISINQSIYASKKVRHLRKSANPMRRRWNSSSMNAFALNPTPGKKRVQCHVCMKTFCDKGALKIHYSAVHLREMHKCTVEGCNMMFSSRRSRNRHSANPNPKLHTPNCRRKISPHDGRVANPLPLIPPSMPYNHSLISPLFPEATKGHLNDLDSPLLGGGKPSGESCMNDLPSLYQLRENNSLPDGASMEEVEDLSSEKALPLTNKHQSCDSEVESHVSNSEVKPNMNAFKSENSAVNNARGVRKRKSLNPTRCAINDHHGIGYTSTDDSSSEEDGGVSFRQEELDDSSDNNILSDSESDSESMAKDIRSMIQVKNEAHMEVDGEDRLSRKENRKLNDELEVGECVRPETRSVELEVSERDETSFKGSKDKINENHENGVKIPTSQCDESSENALRQLETLSQSTFCDLLNSATSRLMGNPHLVPASMGFFPSNPAGLFSDTSKSNGISSSVCSTIPTSSDHGSPGVRDNHLLQGPIPSFTESSLLGGMDIPVDKENPRRCIACGKIFQNHFGVKTHYQNVHLKLMHKCTVEGCNAAFPSKRSRDRHSANLNLHRKLLSTSSDPASKLTANFIDKNNGGLTPPSPFGSLPPPHHQNIREELFSRLYDPQHLSTALSFAEFYHGGKLPTSAAEALLTNGDRGMNFFNHPLLPGFPPFLPSAALSHDFLHQSSMCLDKDRETPTSINSSPSPPPPSKSPLIISNNNNNSSKSENKNSSCSSGDESPSKPNREKEDNSTVTVSAV